MPTDETSVQEMERYVRERWVSVSFLAMTKNRILRLGGVRYIETDNREESIKTAYAFTKRREQEIAWKQEEIDWIHWAQNDTQQEETSEIKERILTMLESQLTALKKEMKEPTNV